MDAKPTWNMGRHSDDLLAPDETSSGEGPERRFHVRAGSVSAVRRALHRAPGGARVIGRYDRETIECEHTMDARSFARHWPIVVSRLEKCGLSVVARPAPGAMSEGDLPRP